MPRGGGNDDNRADQMNPNNDSYWSSRGSSGPSSVMAKTRRVLKKHGITIEQ